MVLIFPVDHPFGPLKPKIPKRSFRVKLIMIILDVCELLYKKMLAFILVERIIVL